MTTRTRTLVLLGMIIVSLAPRTATAQQPLGTFQWQLQPYCNVISVVVTGIGGVFSLQGSDDNCGGPRRASVVGTAFQNPDGTIGLGLNIVGAPGGTPLQIDAAVTLPSASGTWRDNTGNAGTFAFTSGAGTGGGPRPVPSAVTAFHTYLPNFYFGPASIFLPLTTGGATEISFTLTANQSKVLTFSAECAVGAPLNDFDAWVDLEIIHNGVALDPVVGNQDAFCGSNGTADLVDGLVRPSITLVVPGAAGVNTIRIQANLNGGATSGWFGESSLVIH
jgi:hypothetical protein